MTNLDSVLKSRDITLPMKVHIVKAMVFPVVTYGCESWTVKKADHWRIHAFKVRRFWKRLLRVPLDSREMKAFNLKGNQPWILTERTDAEAETPAFWSFDVNSWLIGKTPDAGKDWGQEDIGATGWDGRMASPTQWTWTWANFRRWWRTERPGMLQSMGSQGLGHDQATEQQQYLYI